MWGTAMRTVYSALACGANGECGFSCVWFFCGLGFSGLGGGGAGAGFPAGIAKFPLEDSFMRLMSSLVKLRWVGGGPFLIDAAISPKLASSPVSPRLTPSLGATT